MPTAFARALWDQLWKLWYPFVTRLSANDSVSFLNYGYAEADGHGSRPILAEQDEADRACIQLYHRVVSAVDLRGRDVLEVSCGHGGGASYVARYLQPRTVQGVDRNARAIALCMRRHAVAGLTFSQGNALALPFRENAFDVVVNVEASHCYPDVPRFFAEVRRLLRPGGHFLYADFRTGVADRALLQNQLASCGMELLRCEDISAAVVRGMEMNTEKYEDLVRKRVPKFLRGAAMSFAGVKGSAIYRTLASGETVYLCCHLRKPGGAPPPGGR